jgi:hypothetical protein
VPSEYPLQHWEDASGTQKKSSEPAVPNFYQRPLTWLFWIAAVCLDAVALSIDYESRFASAMILGQLFVVSGWLAVGRSHLLARAACFVAAISLIVAPDYVIPRWRSDMHHDVVWPHVLALTIVGATFTTAATALWAALLRGVSARSPDESPPVIRFSVASCLGWMIVVAVCSTGLRVADFSLLADQPMGWISGIGMAGVAAVTIAAALGDYQASLVTRSLNLIATLALAGLVLLDSVPRDAMPIIGGAWAFAAAWIIVMRLDLRTHPQSQEVASLETRETNSLRLVDYPR